MNDDFYVGYLPAAPPGLARTVTRCVVLLMAAAAIVAVLLLAGQTPFATSKFEYGVYREYTGRIDTLPWPVLSTSNGSFLLVAPGKHGFIPGQSGMVNLKASLIERGPDNMLEVLADSVRPATGSAPVAGLEPLGKVIMRGEIVDSKCWLGVMNPGSGGIHRDCAGRCISGGIPPAFAATDATGAARVFLLSGVDGRALNREVLPYVGKRLELTAELFRSGSLHIIRAEPSDFRLNPE
jgi:hypothetical protein